MRQLYLVLLVLFSLTASAENKIHPVFQNNPAENFLTLFFIPSPYPIDWSNPQNLLKSQIQNQFSGKERKLGHVNVHLSCQNESDELTGMSSSNLNSKTQLIFHGAGMGILWHSFAGKVEDKTDLMQELPQYIDEKRLSFLKIKISQSNCQKLKKYLKEYRENNVGRNYGLYNRPRYGEGAGCSAFGASFLDIAQILGDESKIWMSEILVPEKLLGPPIRDRYVGLWEVYAAQKWADPSEPHEKIVFWEPDKMHQWLIQTRAAIAQSPTGAKFQIKDIAGAPGLFIDLSFVEAQDSPIWIQARDDRYYNFHQMLKPSAEPSPR
jgi:hypothetical protein